MLIIDDYYTEGTRIVIDYVHQVYAQLFPFSLSNKTLYLIFDYPYKYYTFKHFEV